MLRGIPLVSLRHAVVVAEVLTICDASARRRFCWRFLIDGLARFGCDVAYAAMKQDGLLD